MADVIPFAPKTKAEPDKALFYMIDDVPVVSQIGDRLEIQADKLLMAHVLAELEDTVEAIRAVYRQMYPEPLSNDCQPPRTADVLTIGPLAPTNDNTPKVR